MFEFRGVKVREARESDVQSIADLEKEIFGALGIGYFGEEHIRCWLEVHPEGLAVAEVDGEVVGFGYMQRLRYDELDFSRPITFAELTDDGYTRKTHRPDGDVLHSVSHCSKHSGAGSAFLAYGVAMAKRLGIGYGLGLSRISGFDAYCRSLEEKGLGAGLSLHQKALWYCLECARLAGAAVRSGLSSDVAGLPSPIGPDPVLRSNMRLPGFELSGVAVDCMSDPESRNCAAIVITRIEQ